MSNLTETHDNGPPHHAHELIAFAHLDLEIQVKQRNDKETLLYYANQVQGQQNRPILPCPH
jgi:hypothetical protein